jgi:hypothetical protein
MTMKYKVADEGDKKARAKRRASFDRGSSGYARNNAQ